MSLLFLFHCIKGQAQNAASIIVLPNGQLTFQKALDTIGKQLRVQVSHDPDCPELLDNCPNRGRMTFKKFFEPLKAQGLDFTFKTDNVGRTMMLIIKRTIPAPPTHQKPKTFLARIVDESAEALPGVTVQDLNTDETAMADSAGMVRFEYDQFPVALYCTHVDRKSISSIIPANNTEIVMAIDPQSLAEVSVSYAPTKRAVSTSGYTTIKDHVPSSAYDHATRRLSGISTATVQSMLEGQVPGLLVTQSSGIPGSSSYLTIRGQSSVINGIDPLYIIDGVPAAAGNSSLSYIQSGSASQSLSPWSFIAPSDIERIDVLRDADATAIYGSRGANGVILITTRRWKAGLPKWDIEFSTGMSDVSRRPLFMNGSEYLAMRREALQNSGLVPDSLNAPDLTMVDTTRNFDWGKWLQGRNARLANIKLGVSGGEKKNNYTLGMDYLTESMPFPTQPDHDRLAMNGNYNHTSLDRRWTLHMAGLSGWDANHQFIGTDPTTFQTLAPDAPSPLSRSGGLNFPPGLPYFNPLSVIRQPYEAISSNYLLSIVGSYQIGQHLSLSTTVGWNQIRTQEFGEMPLASQDPTTAPTATGYFASTHLNSRILEPKLTYERKTGKWLTSWVGGASFQRLSNNAAARTDTGYISDIALQHHDHAILEDTSAQAARDLYTAFFTNLNGNWKDKYILNLSARRDGSSRFPAGHRFGNFGAIAFAWIFTGEGLVHGVLPYISYGKIKVSEGVTGNNQIGDRTLQNIAGTYLQSFQSIPGLYPSNPGATGWEKTYKTELALDLGFFKDRILFNATAYWHRSDNLLQNEPLPMGRSSFNPTGWPLVLENYGYELSLSAKLADNNHFGWDLAVNWTIPRGKLASFPQLDNSPYAGRLIVGQSINVLKGYAYTGVDRKTGLFSFADLNHDGHITAADQKVLGKFDVTGFGGFENTIRWKQIQFQVLIDARLATGINYLAPIYFNNPPGSVNLGLSSNVPKVLLDHWRHPGDEAVYQKIYAAPDQAADSTRQLYLNSSGLFANTAFLRVRKLSIAYTLPPAKALVMHLTSLTFFADVQNLFTFSAYKVDPEIQSIATLPTLRTIEVGIRLTH